MSASPVGTEPAGLVCVCDQQHVGLRSLLPTRGIAAARAPLFSHLLSAIVGGGMRGDPAGRLPCASAVMALFRLPEKGYHGIMVVGRLYHRGL